MVGEKEIVGMLDKQQLLSNKPLDVLILENLIKTLLDIYHSNFNFFQVQKHGIICTYQPLMIN